MMSRKFFLLTLYCLTLFSACSGPREPEFRKITGVKVEALSMNNIHITGKAIYYNPNVIGIKIDKSDVRVKANGFEVGNLSMEQPEQIFAKTEFSIPVEINFPPSKIFERESGLLGGILSTYFERKIDLEYKGTVTMDIGGIKFDVPVEHTERVDLKKKE